MKGWRSAMSYFGRLLGSLALLLVLPGIGLAQESEAAWDAIRPQIFGERAIEDGSSVIELVAPKRAEDAALVPIDLLVRVRAARGNIHVRRGSPLVRSLDADAGEFVFVRARDRRNQRRQAPHGQSLRQGGRRLLGARRQGHDGGESQSRSDALSRVRGPRGGAGPDPASDLFGAPDGPGDAPLHAGVVYRDHHGRPRRQAHLPHGGRDLDQRGPDVSLQLRAERRAGDRRSRRHREADLPAGFSRRSPGLKPGQPPSIAHRKQRISASAWARRRSATMSSNILALRNIEACRPTPWRIVRTVSAWT